MRISFTGTRYGMSAWQKQQLEEWLSKHKNRIAIATHGCCIGSDIQFHRLVRKICGHSVFIAVFPSTASTRAPVPEDADHVHEPGPPLERNKKIVNTGWDQLLATPLQMAEIQRGGTWSAIRYARKRNIPVEIMWRN